MRRRHRRRRQERPPDRRLRGPPACRVSPLHTPRGRTPRIASERSPQGCQTDDHHLTELRHEEPRSPRAEGIPRCSVCHAALQWIVETDASCHSAPPDVDATRDRGRFLHGFWLASCAVDGVNHRPLTGLLRVSLSGSPVRQRQAHGCRSRERAAGSGPRLSAVTTPQRNVQCTLGTAARMAADLTRLVAL